MTMPQLRRRHLLSGVVGATALAGLPALASCSDAPGRPQSTAPADGGRSTATMPAYLPFDKVPTDYPGTEAGALAAYLGLTRPVTDAIGDVPGKGGPLSVMFESELPTPPMLAENAAWQNLNKALGVDLRMSIVAADQYKAKLATMLAGGELPDVLSLPVTGVAQLPRLVESKFTDLTEYLAGDAIQDYPMLAVRPPAMWRATIFNRKIFGIPTPNSFVAPNMVARKDILDQRGLDANVSSAAEFAELCMALTDAKNGIYADNRPAVTLNFVCEMFGVPNQWRVTNGQFTSQYVTEEYKQALDYTAQLWKKGVFRPDAFYAGTGAQIDDWGNGRTALFQWGGIGWTTPLISYGPKNPRFDLTFIHPPKAEGGGPARKRFTSGVYRMGAIRKGLEPDRVREILGVLNYIAAPYGTAEYLDVEYGVEGKDWNWKEAEAGRWLPERTDQGVRERTMMFYLSGSLLVVSAPGYPEITKRAYAYMKAAAEVGDPLPTAGLYSDTDSTKGVTWSKEITATIADIIQGRKAVSDWEAMVKRWRTDCGDRIAGEYAESHAAANG